LASRDPVHDRSRTAGKKFRHVLNTRLLVGTLIATAILATGAYIWRAVQVRWTAAALLDRAEALAEENPDAAAGYLTRYLELRPGASGNDKVKIRLAEVFDKAATSGGKKLRAVDLYADALVVAPDKERVAILGRLGELYLDPQLRQYPQVAQYRQAKLRARELLALDKDSPKGWRVLALAMDGQFHEGSLTPAERQDDEERHAVPDAEKNVLGPLGGPTVVGMAFARAHQLNPGDIEIAERLAGIYRSEPKLVSDAQLAAGIAKVPAAGKTPEDAPTLSAEERRGLAADRVIDEMVAARPKDANAQLALYRYLLRYKVPQAKGQEVQLALKRARQAMADALAYGPDDPQVLLAAADAARQDGGLAELRDLPDEAHKHYEEACRHYQRAIVTTAAIKVTPAAARGYLELAYKGLSETYVAEGAIDRAVNTLRRGIEHTNHESFRLAWQLCDVLIRRGQPADLREGDEAEKALDEADDILKKANFAAKRSYQRLAGLRRAKLLMWQGKDADAIGKHADAIGKYTEAIPLLTAVAAGQQVSGDEVVGGPTLITPQVIYEAWMLLGAAYAEMGAAHAELGTAAYAKLKEWDEEAVIAYDEASSADDNALTAYDEAAMRERAAIEPPSAAAALCKAAGRIPAAIRYYEKALTAAGSAKGLAEMQRQAIYKQLIALLDQEKQTAEADRYRARLQSQTADSARLTLEEAARALREGRPDEALAIAQRGEQARPDDPLAYVAEGQALWAKKDEAKAEAAFQKAVEKGVKLAPGDARPTLALFEFYAGSKQADRARKVLEKVADNEKLTEMERALLAAGGYAQLGDRKLAVTAYRKAVELSKGDPAVQMRLVEFLLRGNDPHDAAEAEKVLRGMAKQHDPARRRLAQLLVERGGELEWQEAQGLLLESSVAGDAELDRLFQVRTLMVRGGKENLEKAERLCEELLADSTRFAPAVHLLLAQVQQVQGRPEEARKHYRELVDRDRPNPAHTAAYISFLLEYGPPEEVDGWLKKLEKLAPDNLGTARLRARWLRDQGRSADIEPLVEGLAEKARKRLGKADPPQEAQLAQEIGNLYQGVAQYAAAERWYRRLIKLSPDRFESLARALAAQGKVREAIAVCEEAGKTDKSARPALTMTMVLVSGRASAEDRKLAEPQLKQALEEHKDNLALLENLAAIRVLEDRADEAAELYRQILRQQPKHPGALNNLATLLAEQPQPEKRKEALECVDRAIQLIGPQPGLLDTKGMILIFDGKPDLAVELLKEAASVPRPDPRCCFHLAVAYDRVGDAEQARAALKKARAGDLDRQVLTAMDRKLLLELDKKLGT
jgi:tetratricopeptide (TPR) repeat protein